MIKLRHLFLSLVGCNMLLLVIFLNVSSDSLNPAKDNSQYITNLVSEGSFIDKVDSYSYNNDMNPAEKYDNINSTSCDEPKEQSSFLQGVDSKKEEPVQDTQPIMIEKAVLNQKIESLAQNLKQNVNPATYVNTDLKSKVPTPAPTPKAYTPLPTKQSVKAIIPNGPNNAAAFNVKIDPSKIAYNNKNHKFVPNTKFVPNKAPSKPAPTVAPIRQVTSKADFTYEDLMILNEKIKTDPQLKKFVETFKTLKEYYDELGHKYTKLDAEYHKIQEGAQDLAAKHAQLRGWYDFKKQAFDNRMKEIEEMNTRKTQVETVLRLSNPFFLLGAYPDVTLDYFNSYPDGKPFYWKWNYGLHNDNDYCETVDFYNLAHPENMFRSRNFFTDYAKNGLARTLVMRKIGYDMSWKISKYMDDKIFKSRTYHLDPRINFFFSKRVDLHIYHEIGKHFLCATQMYNHIPGHGVLKRKDMIVDSVDIYAARYQDKPQCFNKHTFFPFSYRLYIKEECQTFFTEINSQAYLEKQKYEPIQYLIKVGFGAHRANGVFLLDQNQTYHLKLEYENGALCGIHNRSMIAQTYITNPLLLDLNNKFDFRIYMLVASTNPLIAFYHDGFLRVSLNRYDKFSNDRSTHLTNTHLSKDIFAEVKEQNITLNGMDEEQLKNYQMWTLERLQTYLLASGKIKDPNWLDNYLRPKFREAFIHTIRMTMHAFWKGSNVFEMFGLDFMLDGDLNLWFIECNSSPQLIGTNEHKTNFLVKMLKDLFEIQYAYYRSRMTRVMEVVKLLQAESNKNGPTDYTKYRTLYQEASVNKLGPGYTIKKTNGFVKIMDLNLKGPSAYFGNLRDECVDE